MNKGLSNFSQSNQKSESFTILERIARGDELAVNECLDTYENLVWGLAKRSTKTREDAEDAVQEIFIDIWKSAARFNPAKSPETAFIIMLAKRRLIDRLRKFYRQPQTSSLENEMARQTSDDHKKLHMFVELKPALEELNKLSFREKQIIQMSIYGGISHSEIAKTIGLPLGTVKTKIRRGLKKIRNSIEPSTHLAV